MNTGYWHCLACAKPVALNVDGAQSLCAECGSPDIKWIEPKAARLETPGRRPMTPDETRFHFTRLRAVVEH